MKHYGDIDGIGLDGAGGVNELKNFGLIPVRLTETERDALTDKPIGLLIDNTTADERQRWNGSSWIRENNDSTGSGGGITIDEVSSAVPVNTTSNTYSSLLGMSITPPSAGDYALWFSTETQGSASSTESQYAVFVNGVEVLGSSKSIRIGNANTKVEATIIKKISYTTGVIEIRFRRAFGPGIVTSVNRTLMLIS